MATILVVDERTSSRDVATLLESHGHRILEPVNGGQVLDIVRAEKPDLVLTDILMPEPGGYPLVQQLRAREDLVQTRVVFLAAACVEAEAGALARACGVPQLVTTPAESEKLLAAIEAALRAPPPPAWRSQPDPGPVSACLRQMAGKLYQRLAELEQLMDRYSGQLEVARSALGQEVTKRLWAEEELTQAYSRLLDKAVRDALTGLYNRGYLEESLDREASRSRRNDQPFGVMMIDIDHFKRCNDMFGHAAGDAVLRTLGQYLLSLSRREDIPCRYGGEEFALVMTHASPATVLERAERLRRGVQELKVERDGRSVGRITLSIGIAMYPDHGASGQAVLQSADAALYRAKQAGRNRVVLAENPAQS